LNTKDIDRAIREVREFKRELTGKLRLFMQRLTEDGTAIAKYQVISLGAYDTGDLAESLEGEVMYTDGGNKGIIFTSSPYAAFVEFGTGVMGQGSPHPEKPWAYDVNEHGEAGWVYYDEREERFRWTKGMPSRPFMYNTAIELESRARQIAKEVFG